MNVKIKVNSLIGETTNANFSPSRKSIFAVQQTEAVKRNFLNLIVQRCESRYRKSQFIFI